MCKFPSRMFICDRRALLMKFESAFECDIVCISFSSTASLSKNKSGICWPDFSKPHMFDLRSADRKSYCFVFISYTMDNILCLCTPNALQNLLHSAENPKPADSTILVLFSFMAKAQVIFKILFHYSIVKLECLGLWVDKRATRVRRRAVETGPCSSALLFYLPMNILM